MSKRITFQERGWDDYLYWQTQDKKTLKQINKLLKDIMRNDNDGIGKPEPLTGNFAGYWSRHIDEQNRLVYRIQNNVIEIVQCKNHYNDK